jgi:TetR/AcrR family transcriptional regulator
MAGRGEAGVKTQEPFDERLGQILRKACAVFAAKGYHRASVRDIGAATGVSPAGLYYYFRSKEELLFLIQDHCLEALLRQVVEETNAGAGPEERIRGIVRAHLEFCTSHWEEMKVLAHDFEALSGELRRNVLRRMHAYTSLVDRTLAELRPQRNRAELRASTFALFGMLNWVHTWYRPERDLPVDCLAEHFSRLFLRGFLSRGMEGSPIPPRESGPAIPGPLDDPVSPLAPSQPG